MPEYSQTNNPADYDTPDSPKPEDATPRRSRLGQMTGLTVFVLGLTSVLGWIVVVGGIYLYSFPNAPPELLIFVEILGLGTFVSGPIAFLLGPAEMTRQKLSKSASPSGMWMAGTGTFLGIIGFVTPCTGLIAFVGYYLWAILHAPGMGQLR